MSIKVEVHELNEALNLPANWAEVIAQPANGKKTAEEAAGILQSLEKQVVDFIRMEKPEAQKVKPAGLVDHELRHVKTTKGPRAVFFVTTHQNGRLVIDGGKEVNAARGRLVLFEGAKGYSLEPAIGESRLALEFTY